MTLSPDDIDLLTRALGIWGAPRKVPYRNGFVAPKATRAAAVGWRWFGLKARGLADVTDTRDDGTTVFHVTAKGRAALVAYGYVNAERTAP